MGDIHLGIVCSTYYPDYREMLDAALSEAEAQGAVVSIVSSIPGAFDSPLIVKRQLEKDYIDAVIVLGVVLPLPYESTGAAPDDEVTSWDETLANQVLGHLDRIAIETGKPVIKEIIGPGFPVGMIEQQLPEYARAGVRAAIALVNELKRIATL
jgi:6,7-dimethyl-8-ribityllumazine synthase